MSQDETDRSELEAVLDDIDEMLMEGQFDEAEAAIDEAIAEYGDVDDLLILRAESALEAEEYEECIFAVDDALEKVEDELTRGRLLESRGYAKFYVDQLDEARRAFNESVRLAGASWTALLGRAMVHEELLYFRAALLDLDRAIEMDDQEAQPFAIRGSIYLRQGQLEEAEGDLAHAISLDPHDEESRLNLARIQAIGRRTSAAIETLEPLVEHGEDRDFVMPAALLRSQLSLTLGSTDAGCEDAQRAIEVAPDEPWGHLQLAACRLTAMQPGEAVAALKEAESKVDDVDQIPDALALRASAYDQLEKPEKAAQMRDRAQGIARLPAVVYGEWLNPAQNLPINPNKPVDARTIMSQIFGDPEQAPEGYEEALRAVIDRIPQMIAENPEANQIRIRLPEVEGAEEAPNSLVLQVNRPKSTGGAEAKDA